MEKKLVSILISNYNKSKHIKRCLKSCLNQDYRNFEIIFVDDNSTDNSLKIVETFKNVKILKTKSKRTYPAINQINAIKLGLRFCKGEVIFLLDSDDFFKKRKLSKIVNYFTKFRHKHLFCDVPKKFYSINKKSEFNIKRKTSLLIWPTILPTSCIAIKKFFLKKCLNDIFIKENKFHKLEIDFRIAVYANNIKQYNIISDNLTYYFQNNSGIMSEYRKFSENWWTKRLQAHYFVKEFNKINNINYRLTFDYVVTFFICFFINLISKLKVKNLV